MFTIIGRRWFDRKYGNTYHSVAVYKDGDLIGSVDFAYGYGDQYKQTAYGILQNLGYYRGSVEMKDGQGRVIGYDNKPYNEDYRKFNFSKRSGGDGNLFTVSDVGRKKDL